MSPLGQGGIVPSVPTPPPTQPMWETTWNPTIWSLKDIIVRFVPSFVKQGTPWVTTDIVLSIKEILYKTRKKIFSVFLFVFLPHLGKQLIKLCLNLKAINFCWWLLKLVRKRIRLLRIRYCILYCTMLCCRLGRIHVPEYGRRMAVYSLRIFLNAQYKHAEPRGGQTCGWSQIHVSWMRKMF